MEIHVRNNWGYLEWNFKHPIKQILVDGVWYDVEKYVRRENINDMGVRSVSTSTSYFVVLHTLKGSPKLELYDSKWYEQVEDIR